MTERLEANAKIHLQKVQDAGSEYAPRHAYKYEAKWFFIPLALGFFSALLGSCSVLYFLSSAKCKEPLSKRAVFDVAERHAVQSAFDVRDFVLRGHKVASN